MNEALLSPLVLIHILKNPQNHSVKFYCLYEKKCKQELLMREREVQELWLHSPLD